MHELNGQKAKIQMEKWRKNTANTSIINKVNGTVAIAAQVYLVERPLEPLNVIDSIITGQDSFGRWPLQIKTINTS